MRDETLGQDLTQDVCARLMNGDFSGADEQRRRFRDYLKTAVRNIARNHWRREKLRSSQPLPESLESNSSDGEAWVAAWRNAILDMTWRAMEAWESKIPNAAGHTLLRLRAEFPDEAMDDIAVRLNQATDADYKTPAVRTQLHRARTRFAELHLFRIQLLLVGVRWLHPPELRILLDSLGDG